MTARWDAFTDMAGTLQRLGPATVDVRTPPERGPTATMLAALASGHCDAAQLAAAAGVRSALVMPLLKNHLASGRVVKRLVGERMHYELASAGDVETRRQLRDARRLLELHDFLVVAPTERMIAPNSAALVDCLQPSLEGHQKVG